MAINATALQQVVMAGQKIMYDKKVFPFFKTGMMKEGPLPDKLAHEAAGLIKMMQERAKPSIPASVIAPAGLMLMLEMASFMHKAGLADPTKGDIRAAGKILLDLLDKMFGTEAAPTSQAMPQQAQAQPPQPQQPPPRPAAPQGILNRQVGA